jgi:hypothetical protein
LPFETGLYTPLVGGPRVLSSEWHFYVAEASEGSDEHGGGLVYLDEGYLEVTQVGIQKTHEFAPGSEVYNLLDSGERERIVRGMPCSALCYEHTSAISHSFFV